MNNIIMLLTALAGGMLLGILFFGGLWLTVHKCLSSARPGLWFMGSLLLRLSILLAGCYFITGGQVTRLAACLAGLLIMRTIITSLSRRPAREQAQVTEGGTMP